MTLVKFQILYNFFLNTSFFISRRSNKWHKSVKEKINNLDLLRMNLFTARVKIPLKLCTELLFYIYFNSVNDLVGPLIQYVAIN